MSLQILQGDCRGVLPTIPSNSIQCCVTSPPYWGLRDYGHPGQIGQEKTPETFVEAMRAVFAEVRRVLKPDGTLWLNLGDCYTDKNLAGIPWRVAFALQQDGWYLRSDIIWAKPNPMPESITDRPTKAHEYLFLLTKSGRYYYDAGAVAERAVIGVTSAETQTVGEKHLQGARFSGTNGHNLGQCDGTRNRRTVWEVPTSPYSGAHFATYPPELIKPCLIRLAVAALPGKSRSNLAARRS